MDKKNISSSVSKLYCLILLLLLIGTPFASCIEGDLLWKTNLGIDGNGSPKDIEIDDEDNIVIAGHIIPNGKTDTDICIVKYNSYGNVLWKKLYDGGGVDEVNGIAIDSEHNIIVVGGSKISGQIAKYNLNGDILWMLSNTGDNETGEDIVVDLDGNIYAAFRVKIDSEKAILIIRKYNQMGTILWEKEYPEFESKVYCDGLLMTKEDTVIMFVRILNNDTFNTKMVRYDGNDGNKLTESDLSPAQDLHPYLDSFDNAVTTGISGNGTIISKYSLEGIKLWSVTTDSEEKIFLKAMKLDSYNKIFLVGGLKGKGVAQMYSSSGSLVEVYESNSTNVWNSIGIDSLNNLIVSGNEYNKSNEWHIIKYEGIPPPPSPPVKLRATIKATPSAVQICDYIYVTMTVKNIGKSDTLVFPTLYVKDNPDMVYLYRHPEPAIATLKPSESHTFVWVYTGKKGRFIFKGYAMGENNVKSGIASSNAVTIKEPCIESKILIEE